MVLHRDGLCWRHYFFTVIGIARLHIFCGGTGYSLPLSIIKKYGFRPKIIIIHLDAGEGQYAKFFSKNNIVTENHFVTHGKFERTKNFFSKSLIWRLFLISEMYAPEWIKPYLPVAINPDPSLKRWMYYRSVANGSFEFSFYVKHNVQVPIGQLDCQSATPDEFIEADYFMKEISEVGAEIFFTLVPHGSACPLASRELAAYTKKDIFIVDANTDRRGLYVLDSQHLDESSSILFTKAILNKLVSFRSFVNLVDSRHITALKQDIIKAQSELSEYIESISSSSQLNLGFGPEKILRIDSPIWHTQTPPRYPEWVRFDFHQPISLVRFSMSSQPSYLNGGREYLRAPADFTFQASADGYTWVDLLAVKDLVYARGEEWKDWSIENKTAYPHYRIYITRGGDPHVLTIHRVGLG